MEDISAGDGAVGRLWAVMAIPTAERWVDRRSAWATVIPTVAWAGGIASVIVRGAIAGLLPAIRLPAIRAARLSLTESLRMV